MRRFLLIPALLCALTAAAHAQTTVSTGAPTDNLAALGADSQGGYAVATAQLFRAPVATSYLQSFSFYLSDYFIGDQVFLDAAVYQFDTDHVTGAALFTSELFAGTNDALNPVQYSFGGDVPLNVALSPSVTYALVLSALDGGGTSTDGAAVQVGLTGTNANGGILVAFPGPSAVLDVPGAFSNFGLADQAMRMTFTNAPVTATPEPASTVLVASGLTGLGGLTMVRRRRRV